MVQHFFLSQINSLLSLHAFLFSFPRFPPPILICISLISLIRVKGSSWQIKTGVGEVWQMNSVFYALRVYWLWSCSHEIFSYTVNLISYRCNTASCLEGRTGPQEWQVCMLYTLHVPSNSETASPSILCLQEVTSHHASFPAQPHLLATHSNSKCSPIWI